MKFNPQLMDKVHDNVIVYNSFGTNANRHKNHFKAIFSFQKSLIEPPHIIQYAGCKVKPLLM